jgi:hypothetical protein
MWTVVSLSLLTAWLGVSILAQFDIAAAHVTKDHDAFSLLPRWSFFAPHPGTFDYHLWYRDLLSNNTFAAWREVLPAGKRTIGSALWNPEKRCYKALSDTVDSLVQLRKSDPKPSLTLTMPYLTILNYVASRHHDPQATATQFMILRTEGFLADSKPRLVFRSGWHIVAP